VISDEAKDMEPSSSSLSERGGAERMLTTSARKLSVTVHVVSSVGWLGSVAAFLALSVAGATSRDGDVVRGAYVSMNVIGQFVIVPLSLASVSTGLLVSLGSSWGLFRYYWVLMKLLLTIGATVLLLLHQFTAVSGAARRVVQQQSAVGPTVGPLATQLIVDAGLGLLVLLVTTVLSIYKPWGRTRHGRRVERRRQRERLAAIEQSLG